MKLPKIIGKIVYLVNYPLIYSRLCGSGRAYVIIKCNNRVLLTKNWLGLHHHWRLPGGGVKTGENQIKAVIREVAEEVGIQLKAKQLHLLTDKARWSKHHFYYNLYKVELKTMPKICLSAGEITSADFFSKNKVKKLCLSEVALVAQQLLGWD